MSRKLVFFILVLFMVVVVIVIQTSLISRVDLHKTSRRILAHFDSAKFSSAYIPPHKNRTGNLPDFYLGEYKKPKQYNKTCAKFPDLFDLQFRNDHWQIQSTRNGTIHLLNSYLDQRRGETVRILAMYDVHPVDVLYCQFWYEGRDQPIVVESEPPHWLFRPKWGADVLYFFHPYLISCEALRVKDKLPLSVSVVAQPCHNPSNNLKIFTKTSAQKQNFVVCVKGLSFPFEDNSARLVEWIELLNILGADKINFYEYNVHPNTKKLLDYYEDKGRIEVTPLTLVGDYSNDPYLQNLFLKKKTMQRRLEEVLPYNDCLYKHLHQFKYVVLLDTDEIIVPASGTWIEFLDPLEKTKNVSSWISRNVYFLDSHLHEHEWFDGIPRRLHMLQHVIRARDYTKPGHFVKGFHNTTSVVSLHNHYPFSCFGACKSADIDVGLAHLQHYRADCANGVSECDDMKKDSVVDTRVWHYKDELLRRVEAVFHDLGFQLY